MLNIKRDTNNNLDDLSNYIHITVRSNSLECSMIK